MFAHDARTGELIWKYDPEVPKEWGVYACCDVVNRGVAAWEGKIIVGTLDGRLVALDAGTGEEVWSVQTTPEGKPYTITGAPRIVKGQVIIGNGGGEYGVRGYITAYDVDTGEEKWRFYTVPGNPDEPFEGDHLKAAASTWRGGEWWTAGGGGTVWDSMAYDAELDLLYIGVGNGSPWNRQVRCPAAETTCTCRRSLPSTRTTVAMPWHYQTTPGDTWDYTATQHMILADVEIAGEMRQVIMQAPKNGFFYVIDRTNGEFISAEAYVPVTWASHVDPETGKPVENPNADYAEQPILTMPAPYGGHNWHPMTYSPRTGLVYIPALEIPFMYGQDNAFAYNPKTWNLAVDMGLSAPPDDAAEEVFLRSMVKGHLAAWDPVTQREVFRVQHSGSWNGGLLSTASISSSGPRRWKFRRIRCARRRTALGNVRTHRRDRGARDLRGRRRTVRNCRRRLGRSVRRRLRHPCRGGQRHPRRSYPDVQAGGRGRTAGATAAAHRLAGAASDDGVGDVVEHGEDLFHAYCSVCHGGGAVSSGVLPDLRYMDEQTHAIFEGIVRGGAYAAKGMVQASRTCSTPTNRTRCTPI